MMEIESYLTNSKWEILSELSKSEKSPMELASIFNTSIANISQQLNLMEASGIIGKVKIKNHQKGKPRTNYFIKEELLYLVRLEKNFASKQLLKRDPFTVYILNILSMINKKDQFFLSKFFCDNADLLANSSIGVFKNNDSSIELFIITENLIEARKRVSNIELINYNGNNRKIICWTHNHTEINQGLKHNDVHFLNLVKESTILYDEKKILEKFKETLQNE